MLIPYQSYHGSRFKNLTALNVQFSGTGIAGRSDATKALWFTSSIENAAYYTDVQHEDEDIEEYIYDCQLAIQNPMHIDLEQEPLPSTGMYGMVALAKSKGHDGLIIENIVDGTHFGVIYAVWDNNQILSIKPVKSRT